MISVTQPSRFAIQAETVCHPSSEGSSPSNTRQILASSAPSWNEILTVEISTAVKSGHVQDPALGETSEKLVRYGEMTLLVSRREDVIYYRIRIDVVYHDHIAKNCGNFEREK